MKQDTHDMIQRTSIGLLGTAGSWTLQDISTVGSIAVSVATVTYLLVQIIKLLREMYLREKAIDESSKE